jgi:2-polyprenyl-3-methyl-5-hydroxy-6-metoxy-1,4-benzoquinol methylase
MTEQALDEAKLAAFGEKFVGAINGASVVALASLGRHTGLFDAMAQLPASTSEQIAKAAGLEERYVREWLGGLVVGGVIEYDPADATYTLPPEYAALLTTAAGPNDLTQVAQIFPYLGLVQDELVECFRTGGGVPYASFPKFQQVQEGMTHAFYDATLIGGILPLAPGLTEKLQAGAEALDIGTGGGHAVNLLAQSFPASRFAGYDFSPEGIGLAQAESRQAGVTNTRFEVRDIAKIEEPGRYDLITAFEVVHDLARPADVLRGVYESLKPGGVFLIVDIAASSKLEENLAHPLGPAIYTFSVFHCMTVSLSQGGAGLGTAVGEQKTTELLRAAGFNDIEVKHVEGDIFYAYYIARKA